MKIHPLAVLLVAVVIAGCGDHPRPAADAPHKHEHKPPHGGTPVVLGDEEFHLEIVADPSEGKLTAFVMDGELENFVRLPATSFTVVVPSPPPERRIVFKAVGNSASGETVGDTAQFEAQADWLKTEPNFDAVLPSLTVRSRTYTNVSFNFPKGNEMDEEPKK